MNALILFSYGTIESVDDIESFYNHLFHGTTPKNVLNNGVQLFKSLGTCDPLASTTKRIGQALVRRLEKETAEPWTFYVGNKHTSPFIEDVVQRCIEDGVRNIVTMPLTPLYSKSGTRQYERQVDKALGNEADISVKHVSFYYNNESFIEVVANRLENAIQWLPVDARKDAEIIFTAHSMPGLPTAHEKFIEQYEYLGKRLIEKISCSNYQFAYRSGGPSPQRWLGPDVLDVVEEAAKSGRKAIIACELLSVIANAEVIQEVGRDGQGLAHSLDMEFVQTEYLNDSDDFITVLTDLVLQQARNEVSIEV